jgi:hypothetical protein
MRWLKTYETFDFSQTLPVTSKSELTLYYHCDNCDCLWKEFNQDVSQCKSCESSEIEELSRDEWYETIGNRFEEETETEKEEIDLLKREEEEDFVDLTNLKKDW